MNKRHTEAKAVMDRVITALAEERVKKGFSQRKLATLAGVTQPGLAYVEKGKRNPTTYYLLRLCRALEIELWPLIKKAETHNKMPAKSRK